jgi:hypothetical protein
MRGTSEEMPRSLEEQEKPMDMNSVLQEFVQERGIPIFGIASADGFEHALPGRHPKQKR